MFNAWFILYHKYSRKTYRDAEGIDAFKRDVEWAARCNVRVLMIENYFKCYGEYLDFWSRDTLREMIGVAHQHEMKVLPYTASSAIDTNSLLYKLYGDEWSTKIDSILGGVTQQWAFRSEPDGGLYWKDYREETLSWISTCAATSWYDHYLAMVKGLLEFGFDGIYIDQYRYGMECVEHPEANDAAHRMLADTRRLVKQRSKENLICANVGSHHPKDEHPEFVERTRLMDYGLTESATGDIRERLAGWMEETGLSFFFMSHGSYESHMTKVKQAKELGQPLCIFSPLRLSDTDPRILKLYET